MQQAAQKGMPISQMIHTVIGICIIFLGKYLPAPSMLLEPSERLTSLGLPVVDGMVQLTITPLGMDVLGMFLGVIYLWTTVDTVWPCFLGIFAAGISNYAPMNAVLNQFLGNPMVVQILMVFSFSGALLQSNVAAYIARYLMTRPFAKGRPWVLTALFFFTCYMVALLEAVSSVFLMWPTLYVILNETGFKKGDKYTSCMVVSVVALALCAFCTDAIKNGAFFLVSAVAAMAANNPEMHVVPLGLVQYLLFAFTVSILFIILLTVFMKFILRLDLSRLENFDVDSLNRNPLPPMTWKQKGILALLGAYVLWMILPSLLPKGNPVGMFITANNFGGAFLLVTALFFIQYKGEKLAEIGKCYAAAPIGTFYLIAVAMFFGGAVNNPGTNIPLMLEFSLGSLFQGMSSFALLVTVILVGIILTNFFNSVVAGLILIPVLSSIANTYGLDAAPMLAVFFYAVLFALATPAASPFAALVFANTDWVDSGDVVKYGVIYSLIVVAILVVVGIPLANMLF